MVTHANFGGLFSATGTNDFTADPFFQMNLGTKGFDQRAANVLGRNWLMRRIFGHHANLPRTREKIHSSDYK